MRVWQGKLGAFCKTPPSRLSRLACKVILQPNCMGFSPQKVHLSRQTGRHSSAQSPADTSRDIARFLRCTNQGDGAGTRPNALYTPHERWAVGSTNNTALNISILSKTSLQ